jgi:N-carbamoyl-L-amino-acid hydrolase
MSIQIDGERLWNNLMEIAKIGGTEKGGCNRQALTDTDIQGRAQFIQWCEDLGLSVSTDAIGNLFTRLEGSDPNLDPLVIGSHLDTQPTGGKYDGILGVLAGLEVVRTLIESSIRPTRSIEIVSWMNEEGSRFAPAMMGSGVYAKVFDIEETREIQDIKGISVGQELDRHGFSCGSTPAAKDIHAYLELHIEQGPILEAKDTTIGVVTGAQGIRWYDIVIIGEEAHAGPTPMSMRKDPMRAVGRLIDTVLAIGNGDDQARATIGRMEARPGSHNVIPGEIYLSVDFRNPDEDRLTQMDVALRSEINRIRAELPQLHIRYDAIWHSPVVTFDPALITSVRSTAKRQGHSHMDIISGAGHDALYVARRAPTTMIFIPCRDGISHNEREHAEKDHCTAGANVLLGTVLDQLGINRL